MTDDALFFTLLGLHTGDPLTADGGDLVLANQTDRGVREWVVPVAVLDELESRGWVEIPEAGPVLTDRGRYWLDRMLYKRTRRRLSETRFRKVAAG